MDKEFSDEELSHLYTRFYPRNTFDPSKYQPHEERQGFLAWLDGVKTSAYRYVPKNVRILDIGCGSCETLGYHQKRGCEVYGVETDENVKPIVEQNHFQVHFGLFNPDVFEKSSFDFITMDHVLEHCQNPLETIKGIGTLLKDSNICDKIWGGGG
jgi:2-polyprenyl-3-methyl-5-hydroxy-6-metoxy-1,4-benzoquinol methylase